MARFLALEDGPGVDAPSWYAATAPRPPARVPLQGEARADVAVIGGGFAGLSAALHLAEAGRSVALLEAHRVGWGASGRNGGQLARLPRREMAFFEAALGREDAARILAVAEDAALLVARLAERFEIDCDLAYGALSLHHKRRYDFEEAREAERLRRVYGVEGLSALSPEEVRALCAAQGVFGGVHDARAGQIHPLKFALGLAEAAAQAGARIHERSVVERIDLAAGRVETASGAILAERVLIAANGYHDGLERRTAARVMPLNNFLVATAPLGARAAEAMAPRLTAYDSRFVVNYFRLTPDGRLLFGGGESAAARHPRDVAGVVRRRMLRLFPTLADIPIAFAWGGTLGLTATRAPAFLALDHGGLSIGGWSGSGIHMSVMGGRIAAEALLGAPERFELMARAPTPPFPGGGLLRRPLMVAALNWYRLRDWL